MRVKRHPRFHVIRGWINQIRNVKSVNLDGVLVHAEAHIRSRIGAGVWKTLMRGGHEYEERKLLIAALRPDDRVLEIGAGLGVISILAARMVGEGNATSYEANPALKPEIRANHKLNGLYPKLIMKAVSSESGFTDFHVATNVYASSVHAIDGFQKARVECESVNQAIMDHDPSFLVIDAEGAELQLLPNAEFRNIRAMLVELHPWLIGEVACEEIRSALVDKGFSAVMSLGDNFVFERKVV